MGEKKIIKLFRSDDAIRSLYDNVVSGDGTLYDRELDKKARRFFRHRTRDLGATPGSELAAMVMAIDDAGRAILTDGDTPIDVLSNVDYGHRDANVQKAVDCIFDYEDRDRFHIKALTSTFDRTLPEQYRLYEFEFFNLSDGSEYLYNYTVYLVVLRTQESESMDDCIFLGVDDEASETFSVDRQLDDFILDYTMYSSDSFNGPVATTFDTRTSAIFVPEDQLIVEFY